MQKGTKLHQLLPKFIRQFMFLFLQKNGLTDTFENFREFASRNRENSMKLQKKSTGPFSREKINCPMKFGNG